MLKYATGTFRGISNTGSFLTQPRHSDGANYLMADNHAKYFRPSAISPGATANTENDKQIDGSTAAGTNGTFSDGVSQPAATWSLK